MKRRKFSEVAGIFSKAEVPAIIAQNDKKGRVWTGVFACEDTGLNIMLNATDNPFSPVTGGSMRRVDVANEKTEFEFDQSDLEDLVVVARDEENGLVFRADAALAAQLDGKEIYNPMTGEKMTLAAELEDDEELELAGDEDADEDEEVEASGDEDEDDAEEEVEASDDDAEDADENSEEAGDEDAEASAETDDEENSEEAGDEDASDDDVDELFGDESGDDEDSDDEDESDEDEDESEDDEDEDEIVEDEDESDEDDSDDEEDEEEDEDESDEDEDESEDEEEDEDVEAMFRNFASEASMDDIFSEIAANHVELSHIDVVPVGDRYYIIASDTPIAHASKTACSEAVAKIFDKQALYRSALVAEVAKSSDGINQNIVANFGLTLLETEIPVSEAVANEVTRRVEKEKSQIAVEKAALQGRLEHAFEVACSGFNKSMFGRNPLHAGFISELAQLGLPDAENIVNGVFRKHSEALMKAIIGKAKELASASDDKLNTYAEMAKEREFNQGGDFSSSLSRVGVIAERTQEKETASVEGDSRFPGLQRRLQRLGRIQQ